MQTTCFSPRPNLPSQLGPQWTPKPHLFKDQCSLKNSSEKSTLGEEPGSQNEPKGHPQNPPGVKVVGRAETWCKKTDPAK